MKTTTEELLAFVSVIDAGSITAAAETLQQTVSGVSRALTRLEKKLDATLVHRTTRRLQLTDEGELFLSRARAILAANKSLLLESAEALLTKETLSEDELRPFADRQLLRVIADRARLVEDACARSLGQFQEPRGRDIFHVERRVFAH